MKPKPRLKRAPLTNEDMEIRRAIAWRLAHNILGASYYRIALVAADQRDADLMFYAQQFKLADVLRVCEGDAGVIVRQCVSVCHNADQPEALG